MFTTTFRGPASRTDGVVTVGMVRPGLPYLRLAGGERVLVYLPGLSEAFVAPAESPRAFAGLMRALRATHTIYVLGRRQPFAAEEGIAGLARTMAAGIESILKRENMRGAKVDLAGASIGGMCALALARARPDLVARVSLHGAAARLSRTGHELVGDLARLARLGRWGDVHRRMAEALFAGAQRRMALGMITFAPFFAARPPLEPDHFVALLEAMRRPEGAVADGAAMPVQIIAGEADPLFPPEAVEATLRGLSQCELAVLDGAGHALSTGRRRQFEGIFADFLQQRG